MATNTRFATAVHALVFLARQPEQLHSSESIAAKLQTNAVVIRRILAQLQLASLVRNHKGPSGGSELVRPAASISLADIYRAAEQSSMFNDATVSGADAKRIANELRSSFASAETALLRSLSEVSLQQIVKRTAKKKA
ncbi:Rrf2 family transcriptional regulator [Acidipila sp. EB88]|uniref:RrF2 family transcriptional regulator n=1 Tax=Acidipila sp. EB88 TaxID=2305226 RepID=UPI000F5F4ACE|nr:Rrf2 family transcriptional regulator [Acidipila sp. EB88]RRA49663.1 Rrf2 family transcriptional regulator [Acidipila sp. EB88]